MEHRHQLLTLLSDGQFHSGEILARQMGISRTAVWKIIGGCRQRGMDIQAVQRKGYRLARPMELLSQELILDGLGPIASGLLGELRIHEELDSTNRCMMALASDGLASGSVCLTEQQQAGRGRRGRPWVSPYGCNIYLSVLWRYQGDLSSLALLSLATGVAVARALMSVGLEGLGLKWPNDIVWQGRKLAGILLEVSGETSGPCHAVIGIGINYDMPQEAAADIDQPWTDVVTVLGHMESSRNLTVCKVLDQLLPVLDSFPVLDAGELIHEWKQLDICAGREVVLSLADEQVTGTVQGIDNDGALLLDTGKEIRRYHSGDVSMRPL